MEKSYLKVIAIQEQTDKTGLKFQKVTFQPVEMLFGKPVTSSQKPRTRNIWPERTLADGTVIQADPLYGKLSTVSGSEGNIVTGSIVKFRTTPYQLDGSDRELNEATFVIFEADGNPLAYAARQLRDNGAGVLDDEDNVIQAAPRQERKPQQLNPVTPVDKQAEKASK